MPSIIRGVRRIAPRKKGFKMSVEAILMHFEGLFLFLKPTNDKILNLSFLEFGTNSFRTFLVIYITHTCALALK